MSHHRGCENDSVRNSLPTKIESTVSFRSSEEEEALLLDGAACFSLSTLIVAVGMVLAN